MVRFLFLPLLMIFSVAPAFAVSANPWQRVCRIEGGQFWVLNLGSKDDLSLCFFGSAAIGAESLFLYKTGSGYTTALQSYKHKAPSSGGGVCASYGAKDIQGTDSEGVTFHVCQFIDGSIILKRTLGLKPGSFENEALDRALLRTY